MNSLSRSRIELWVEARDGAPAVNPVMQELLRTLEADGATVSTRVLEYEITDPQHLPSGRPPDLALLKTATTLALSVAAAYEISGVKFLNTAKATLRAHDKAATVARLASACLPVPTTFLLESNESDAAPQARTDRAWVGDEEWVVKPTHGVHGRNVAFHPDFAAALETPPATNPESSYVVDDGTRLVQKRIGNTEQDVKVYVAGERFFAGRKTFGPRSYTTDGIDPVTLDPATTEMVRAVGEALELRLFGVDLRYGEDGCPVVIDANPFPGYRGFPEAVAALRSEIVRALGGAGG